MGGGLISAWYFIIDLVVTIILIKFCLFILSSGAMGIPSHQLRKAAKGRRRRRRSKAGRNGLLREKKRKKGHGRAHPGTRFVSCVINEPRKDSP